MNESTRQKLLDLNRKFYATVAPHFHQTRLGTTPGLLRVFDYLPRAGEQPLTILDAGCGNGRFAHMLNDYVGQNADASSPTPVRYIGIDNDEQLLNFAHERAAELPHVQATFAQADLANEGWDGVLPPDVCAGACADLVLCTATMQHLPGRALRGRVVGALSRRSKGLVIISAWQFLTSERFRAKLIDWEAVGLSAAAVEAGDALLPWKQGAYAVRYVHQLDEAELHQLAHEAALEVVDLYRADGKEGNLNLYVVLQGAPCSTE